MIRKGFLKGHADVLNFVVRLTDWAFVFLSSVIAYYYSNAYDQFVALGVEGVPVSYILTVLIAVALSALVFPIFSVYKV